MKTHFMKTAIRFCALVVKPRTLIIAATVLLTVLGGAWPREASAQATELQNAQATFADAGGDKIRSDGLGIYNDDSLDPNFCVKCYVVTNAPGKAFMRTGQNLGYCIPAGALTRELVLDFSAPVGSFPDPCDYAAGNGVLNACGFNSIPDAKIVASDPNPFYRRTTASDVNLSLSVSRPPLFSGVFDFELEFDNLVPASGTGDTRTLTAGSLATATLYRWDYITNPRKPKKLLVAVYKMPFSVTYTKFP